MLVIVAVCVAIWSNLFTDLHARICIGPHTMQLGRHGTYIAQPEDVIGQGSFGKIYAGKNIQNGEDIAIKVESPVRTLPSEANVYKIIGPHRGIPKFIFAEQIKNKDSYALGLELLESSLANLQKRFDGSFSEKTVLMIAIQSMYRLELLHHEGFVHRDLKPGNMGIGKNGKLIYLFDFGLSEKYVDAKGYHVNESRRIESGSGTPLYMSAYAHSHNTQSRRDDLESLGFVLMHFLTGNLPWARVADWNAPASNNSMVRMKRTISSERLCKGYSKQWIEYFNYVRGLSFTEKPDYSRLRQLFRRALKEMNLREDFVFDWDHLVL